MKRHIDYKAPQGKLLRIDLNVEENIIKDINITGDFFVYPEGAIVVIENSLKGKKINEVNDVFDKIIKQENIQVIGFDGLDLVSALSRI